MEIRNSEYDIRKAKVQTLRELGINPYTQKRDKNHTISELQNIHELRSIEDILLNPEKNISIAGRLMLKRVSGKLSF